VFNSLLSFLHFVFFEERQLSVPPGNGAGLVKGGVFGDWIGGHFGLGFRGV